MNDFDRACDNCSNKGVSCDVWDRQPASECSLYTPIADSDEKPKIAEDLRKFDSGATRDTTEGKLSYVRAVSPIVMQRYVQYLEGHRDLPDGSKRDLDNWKGGLPDIVWLEGGDRHHRATWLIHDGFEARDNHGPVTLEDSLCGIIFNASGWLHDLLKEKKRNRDDPVNGGY